MHRLTKKLNKYQHTALYSLYSKANPLFCPGPFKMNGCERYNFPKTTLVISDFKGRT